MPKNTQENGKPKSKLPALFWHPASKRYFSKIGYTDKDRFGHPRPRTRSYQYYGECGDDKAAGDKFEERIETYLQKSREKTSHQNGLTGKWWLFPETVTLLKQFAEKENAHGLLLLNEEDKPLYQVTGAGKIDNITTAFFRLQDAAKIDCRFKDLRKTLATAIGRIAGEDVARVALAQKSGGALKFYLKDAYDKVTSALRQWHAELTAAGVFTEKPEENEKKAK